ncbi:MAG: hypothetical protein WCT04_22860 [Planctomycetota bacterium]
MLVGTDERCARCGTLMRGGRSICPSCGLDQTSLEAHPSQVDIPMAQMEEVKPTVIKKSICPACMSSVRDDTMVAYEHSRICPECFERMKGKMARKNG